MDIEKYVIDAAKFLEEKKAKDIIVLDIRGLTHITDYFIIASGEVQIHLESLTGNIIQHLKKVTFSPRNPRPKAQIGWILLDYGDFVVHLFDEKIREFYNLERIWGKGKIIWQESQSHAAAGSA